MQRGWLGHLLFHGRVVLRAGARRGEVVADDPHDVDPLAIKDIAVHGTVVAGEVTDGA